jgi:hypothetical protein
MYEVRIVKHPGAGGGHRTRAQGPTAGPFLTIKRTPAGSSRGSDFPVPARRTATSDKWERTRRILSSSCRLTFVSAVRRPAGIRRALWVRRSAHLIRANRAGTPAPRTSRLSALRRVRVRHISIRLGGAQGGALRPNLSMRHLGWATHRPRPRENTRRAAGDHAVRTVSGPGCEVNT